MVCVEHKYDAGKAKQLCGAIKRYMVEAAKSNSEKEKIKDVTIQNLINWGVVRNMDGTLLPTNAFVLLTDNVFPFAKIQCALFKGTERVVFIDKRDFEGPLYEQIEEAYDFVKDYPNRDSYKGKDIDISGDCKEGSVPLLMQWDKRWGYDLYGDAMIGIAGCGPTCMTMAYVYHTGDTQMNPRSMAEFAQENGFHTADGTSWDFWTLGASALGLYGEVISLSENAMKGVLDAGGVIVCSMAPGDFTTTGHFILLRGYDENGFFVNDPNREKNSGKQWDYDTLASQIKNLWGIYPS